MLRNVFNLDKSENKVIKKTKEKHSYTRAKHEEIVAAGYQSSLGPSLIDSLKHVNHLLTP